MEQLLGAGTFLVACKEYVYGATNLWSASEYNSNNCLNLNYNGNVNNNNKNNEYGVVPCKGAVICRNWFCGTNTDTRIF